jgi:hypothetical protein
MPRGMVEAALWALDIRGLAQSSGAPLQILVAGRVEEIVEPLRRLLRTA